MINRAGIFNPQLPGHRKILINKPSHCKEAGLTPL
jgi:hypothetical protein